MWSQKSICPPTSLGLGCRKVSPHDLLDRQDSGQALTPQKQQEAEGLVNLSELLTVLRLRAERMSPRAALTHLAYQQVLRPWGRLRPPRQHPHHAAVPQPPAALRHDPQVSLK